MAEPIKTLFMTGGLIHDWKGCGDEIEETLQKSKAFDLHRVDDDRDCFLAENLEPYALIVLYHTRGEMTDPQKNGLLNAVASGKGFVGIHGATVSFRDCPEYLSMVGGAFIGHPRIRHYQVSIADPEHPIMKGLFEESPPEFFVTDEMYVTDYDPRVNVLAATLWQGKTMPVVWTKTWGKGRVFYLALGHDPERCRHHMFQALLIRGAQWAAETPDN